MRSRRPSFPARPRQAGFTMVELLITAFVLAVGILGLSMLQVISLRSSRGSRSLGTAVQIADRVMDQVELEGRLTWLDLTDSAYTTASALPLLRYVRSTTAVVDTFDITGGAPATPADAYFTVTTLRQAAAVGAATTGQMHDFTVTVNFTDTVDTKNAPVSRTVTVTRRIVHG